MKKFLITTSLLALINLLAISQNDYVFKELPYSYDALEPYIDATTMETHYDKHHRAYYNNFVKGMNEGEYEKLPILDIFSKISEYPNNIRNMGGGYWNHEFYWESMTSEESLISDNLLSEIEKTFGSLDNFKNEFSKAANSVFGSGWAWLILTENNELKITKTSNQDNPYMDIVSERGTPLLTIDVWEHAYYLKHKNKRTDYVQDFWNVVNWEIVSERYENAQK